MPTSHDTSVNYERLVLLYYILNFKRMNTGQIMYSSIKCCAEKNKGKLWHPYLLYTLMHRAGVEERDEDQWVDEKATMDTKGIKRMKMPKVQRKPAAIGESSSAPVSTGAATLEDNINRTSFLYLVHTMEQNQQALLDKLKEQAETYEQRLKEQK